MPSRRFLDVESISDIVKSANTFKIRSHGLNPIKIIYYLFIILFATLFLLQCIFGVLTAEITKYQLNNLIASSIAINTLFIFLIIAATYLVYKMQKIVALTEFQSLLFSSALKGDSKFCAIFCPQLVVYLDDGFKKFFNIKSRPKTFFQLLQSMSINQELCLQVQSDISQNNIQSVKSYQDFDRGIKFDLITLKRPNGFFAIKSNRYSVQ